MDIRNSDNVSAETLDIRKPDDVLFVCATCKQTVITLSPEGARIWLTTLAEDYGAGSLPHHGARECLGTCHPVTRDGQPWPTT